MYTWGYIRDSRHVGELATLLGQSSFLRGSTPHIWHIRSAHYAVFVVQAEGVRYIARVGVCDAAAFEPRNTGLLGTARTVSHDQSFEYMIDMYLAGHGAHVIAPLNYERLEGGLDVLWLPFVEAAHATATTGQWTELLASFRHAPRIDTLPVFGNYAKTKARAATLVQGVQLMDQYERYMHELFAQTSRWGVVHGDLHAENVIITQDAVVAYDLDTVSWAPAVWDLTHLANRYGTGANKGYDIDVMREHLEFTHEEFKAALRLRRCAAEIARLAREVEG